MSALTRLYQNADNILLLCSVNEKLFFYVDQNPN